LTELFENKGCTFFGTQCRHF